MIASLYIIALLCILLCGCFAEVNVTRSNEFPRSEIFKSSNDHKLLGKAYMFHSFFDWAISQFELALREYPGQRDTELLTLLATPKEAVGDLYYTALQIDPTNALAHERIGLLYFGIGTYNFGAPLACGLNHNLSVLHLKTALFLDSMLTQSFSALSFCVKEIHQVKQWHTIVGQLEQEGSTTVVQTKPKQKVTARVGNWLR